ncbi:MAG TPA: helix-turn-helix transcriptional regulator [Firmicutes bacterium]|jgi:transcriptional regulator with XRE-family HTH domain|nr:helix-turn-helix transcriptional regulator [Bacillota bacterium]
MSSGIRFGKFIADKRKARGITLRGMAGELDITPAYLSDIEKSRRNPPDINMLEKIATRLNLTQEEKETMFDLAGKDRNEISPDLPDYIMEKPIVTVALRKAKEKATDDDWAEFIRKLDEK